MMKMNNNTSSIGVTIHPLASFASFVLESILFYRPDEFSHGSIFENMNHTEIAMASSFKTSMASDGMGKLSPAANMSSMYIPAASFILSSASCLEYPQLEQPGNTGTEALHLPLPLKQPLRPVFSSVSPV